MTQRNETALPLRRASWPSGNPDCEKCHGTGAWQYDHNHACPCPNCCTHPAGWWLLSEPYGQTDEHYAACYQPGCGTTITKAEWDALPEES